VPERPTLDNELGLHAYRDLDDALEHAAAVVAPNAWPIVCGAVVMWGVILIHQHGYRAQYAKPIALLDTGPASGLAEVGEDYAVPRLPRDELLQYARWWGTVDASR
jgi:hypothetical protein